MKTKKRVAQLEKDIANIQNKIERTESIDVGTRDSDKKEKVSISDLLSVFALAISVLSLIVTIVQARTENLSNKTIISCSFEEEKNEIQIVKTNGISEEIEVRHFPFLMTSYTFYDEEKELYYTNFEPLQTNILGNWFEENINRHSENILEVNVEEWNKGYSEKIEGLVEYFQGKRAVFFRLGHIIEIKFKDPVSGKSEKQYYELITNVTGNSSGDNYTIIAPEQVMDLYDIDESTASSIFNEQCPIMGIMNETTYKYDFEKYILGKQ